VARRRAQKTILVASHNPKLADVRKDALEKAGYRVIPAANVLDVRNACAGDKIDLAIVGYSIPPAGKRQVWIEVRNHCDIPILELYQSGPPELADESRIFTHQAETPTDFVETVRKILRDR
jgi:DNA-binding response OmpR family regulator